jgi:hypothetical protein
MGMSEAMLFGTVLGLLVLVVETRELRGGSPEAG